jgi:hypothetical protein
VSPSVLASFIYFPLLFSSFQLPHPFPYCHSCFITVNFFYPLLILLCHLMLSPSPATEVDMALWLHCSATYMHQNRSRHLVSTTCYLDNHEYVFMHVCTSVDSVLPKKRGKKMKVHNFFASSVCTVPC